MPTSYTGAEQINLIGALRQSSGYPSGFKVDSTGAAVESTDVGTKLLNAILSNPKTRDIWNELVDGKADGGATIGGLNSWSYGYVEVKGSIITDQIEDVYSSATGMNLRDNLKDISDVSSDLATILGVAEVIIQIIEALLTGEIDFALVFKLALKSLCEALLDFIDNLLQLGIYQYDFNVKVSNTNFTAGPISTLLRTLDSALTVSQTKDPHAPAFGDGWLVYGLVTATSTGSSGFQNLGKMLETLGKALKLVGTDLTSQVSPTQQKSVLDHLSGIEISTRKPGETSADNPTYFGVRLHWQITGYRPKYLVVFRFKKDGVVPKLDGAWLYDTSDSHHSLRREYTFNDFFVDGKTYLGSSPKKDDVYIYKTVQLRASEADLNKIRKLPVVSTGSEATVQGVSKADLAEWLNEDVATTLMQQGYASDAQSAALVKGVFSDTQILGMDSEFYAEIKLYGCMHKTQLGSNVAALRGMDGYQTRFYDSNVKPGMWNCVTLADFLGPVAYSGVNYIYRLASGLTEGIGPRYFGNAPSGTVTALRGTKKLLEDVAELADALLKVIDALRAIRVEAMVAALPIIPDASAQPNGMKGFRDAIRKASFPEELKAVEKTGFDSMELMGSVLLVGVPIDPEAMRASSMHGRDALSSLASVKPTSAASWGGSNENLKKIQQSAQMPAGGPQFKSAWLKSMWEKQNATKAKASQDMAKNLMMFMAKLLVPNSLVKDSTLDRLAGKLRDAYDEAGNLVDDAVDNAFDNRPDTPKANPAEQRIEP